jgi:hypothetical protein
LINKFKKANQSILLSDYFCLCTKRKEKQSEKRTKKERKVFGENEEKFLAGIELLKKKTPPKEKEKTKKKKKTRTKIKLSPLINVISYDIIVKNFKAKRQNLIETKSK